MKKYVIVSGFNTEDSNRGTAALSYGAINFCVRKNILLHGQDIVRISYVLKTWRYKDTKQFFHAEGRKCTCKNVHIHVIEKLIYDKFGILLPFTKLRRIIKNTEVIVAINGGDGFSDIYGTKSFLGRLKEIMIALKEKIPYILLPQTLGPFDNEENRQLAENILTNAKMVYVRDEKYCKELEKLHISYEVERDLSAYMEPEPWAIDIHPGGIGINVSGLAFSNCFGPLAGQFDCYPVLIIRIIEHFQRYGKHVYLVPHSYRYGVEDPQNDTDACKAIYEDLIDKTNVHFISDNLSSPRVKYVISNMSFFIGTRMHSNFAAIYTNVPVFGLAYSYKFAGAFYKNGLDGDKQTEMINNISENDIDHIIDKIDVFYQKYNQK